ncbi:MAG: hypothetical protein R2860_13600 [Desulfobacterales bacterium]
MRCPLWRLATEKDLEDIFKQVMETSGLGFGKMLSRCGWPLPEKL